MTHDEEEKLYGLMAEFDTPEALVQAAERCRKEGYKKMDGFSPFPVHGLPEALGLPRNKVPLVTLCMAILGALGGFFLQYWVNVIDYPLNVGGRPYNSWPAFIPVTYECTILFASFGAVFGMFTMNGLPKPYHPVFNVERFALMTNDRFFICIEAGDSLFELTRTRRLLESLKPHGVYEVPS